MVLSKKEKKQLVIQLLEEGKTTREITKIVKISLRDIGIILREYNNEPEPKPAKSDHARAFQLFSKGKIPIRVAIIVDLSFETVKIWYLEYLYLNDISGLVDLIKDHPEFIQLFKKIAEKMKHEGLFEDINILAASLAAPISIHHRVEWYEHRVRCLELKKKTLEEMDKYKEAF